MNLTKIAYNEPRPFMASSKIRAYDCSIEYGNPSGHSLFAAAFFIFVFLDIFMGEMKGKKYNKIWMVIGFGIAIGSIVIIGFSRLYNGVHSLN